jgi:hypothetical protein
MAAGLVIAPVSARTDVRAEHSLKFIAIVLCVCANKVMVRLFWVGQITKWKLVLALNCPRASWTGKLIIIADPLTRCLD